ncbi:hypothetical protein KKB18_07450 [bacterium]|nr:hypothetical protein [bacterium]
MPKIAFIDIGTNSVRMLITDISREQKPLIVARLGHVTKLGEGLSNSHTISHEAMDRTISVIEDYKSLCKKHKCDEIIAFSTSVLRKADNSHEFTSPLKKRTGIKIEIISGEKEASLIFSGVKDDFPHQRPIVLDIGGGSTEISYGDESSKISLKSIDIGALSISEAFSLEKDLSKRRIEDALKYADEIFEHQFPSQSNNLQKKASKYDVGARHTSPSGTACRAPTLVGTGGSITSLAAINLGFEKYNYEKVHKSKLSKDDIGALLNQLSIMSQDEIRKIPTLEIGREDTILGGVVILFSALKTSPFDSISVSTKSILWGMVVEYQKKFLK